MSRLYQRATDLQRCDPHSADMYYLCGALGILSQDCKGAWPYLSTGADLDNDLECLRLLAIASACASDQDTAAYALIGYFREAEPNAEDPLGNVLVRILDYYRLGRNLLHELRTIPRENKAAQDLVDLSLLPCAAPRYAAEQISAGLTPEQREFWFGRALLPGVQRYPPRSGDACQRNAAGARSP
ncbi:hypothetical protein SAMN04489729_2656 [Amycolatopsis lurida]|uniref:Uncharacterized protein n=1 Tax=Amycolatopsis lurida NRRL 2430 TaxID=1460371 RepID=A0A2P2FI33_AMYLU|nr:hypothetical protein [Amycolatopsis lurida]KFU76369.1 hypothetical protein BB31_36600 [Amycolatopsis lurida NRRL 2430]SEC86382.1 hypothetical protein SAMN04489729_2656 [Amycolatopsis lurida]